MSDQIWKRVLFNSDVRGQTKMRVVFESSDQILMRVLFRSRVRGD